MSTPLDVANESITSDSVSEDVDHGESEPVPVAPDKEQGISSLDLFPADTIEDLSCGFMAVLEPEVVRVRKSLDELIVNQEEMLESIHNKRTQFEETSFSTDILSKLQKIPFYKQKLSSISKQMQSLSKRVKRLQQRSHKLKNVRVDRDAHEKEEYKKKLQQERLLEAKPAK